MKKYLLLALICASWADSILPGCTGAGQQGNTNLNPISTGTSTGSFTGSCFLSGSTPQSPFIMNATLNSDNTVTLVWNWYENAAFFFSIIIEYSTDLGANWKFLANSYDLFSFGATSYTTPVLNSGNYLFRVGNVPDNSSCAYFSLPSNSITIGSTVPLTINRLGSPIYAGEFITFKGTFPGSSDNLSVVITYKNGSGTTTTQTYEKNSSDYPLYIDGQNYSLENYRPMKGTYTLTAKTTSPEQSVKIFFLATERPTAGFCSCSFN